MLKYFVKLVFSASLLSIFCSDIAYARNPQVAHVPMYSTKARQCLDDVEYGWKACLPTFIKQMSVRIHNQGSPGSGVLIGDDGSSYLIATANHVVSDLVGNETGEIVFWDGSKSSFTKNNIILAVKDFALITVKNDNSYPVSSIYNLKIAQKEYQNAKLAFEGKSDPNFIDETRESPRFNIQFAPPTLNGTKVLVAGYSLPTSSAGSFFRLSPGFIIENISDNDSKNGYNIVYNSQTISGMSGGGVFAVSWCKIDANILRGIPMPLLIAVHGQGEESLSHVGGKSGFNYAMKLDQFGVVKHRDLLSYFSNSKHRARICLAPQSQWPSGDASGY